MSYPVLNQGATGPYVTALQKALNAPPSGTAANPPLIVDGNFGALTLAALKVWQTSYFVTGQTDAIDWVALGNPAVIPPPPPPPPPPPVVQPNGPTGTWNLVWSDEFPGTSLDTTKWQVLNGVTRNAVPMVASNVSVSGGNLLMKIQSSSSGSCIVSSNQFDNTGIPSAGHRMAVGDVVEASILWPASGSHVANWPSLWFFGEPSGSAPGEIDLFEGLGGSATCNYHPPSGSATINNYPAGTWAGAFHTYTVKRNSTSFDAYVDGTHFLNQHTSDDGTTMSIILVVGAGQSGPPVYPATMQIDYVRAWSPA